MRLTKVDRSILFAALKVTEFNVSTPPSLTSSSNIGKYAVNSDKGQGRHDEHALVFFRAQGSKFVKHGGNFVGQVN